MNRSRLDMKTAIESTTTIRPSRLGAVPVFSSSSAAADGGAGIAAGRRCLTVSFEAAEVRREPFTCQGLPLVGPDSGRRVLGSEYAGSSSSVQFSDLPGMLVVMAAVSAQPRE